MTADLEIKLRNFFGHNTDVVCAFVFGSVAKQQERPDSDIDLAVLLDRSILEADYLGWRLKTMGEVAQFLDREADIVLLNDAGPVLTHQVLAFGKLLYERDHSTTTTFKAKALIEYVDWLPYQERLNKAAIARGITEWQE